MPHEDDAEADDALAAALDGLEDDVADFFLGGPLADKYDIPDDDADDDGVRPYVPVAYEVACDGSDGSDGGDGWAAHAASSLANNGFVVLRAPSLVPAATCAACAAAAAARHVRLLACARRLGLHKTDVLRFTELCSRKKGGMRFDMRYWSHSAKPPPALADADEPTPECWAELRRCVERWVAPALARLSADLAAAGEEAPAGLLAAPRADSLGCVTSLAGAPDQHFHPDGTAVGLYNAFCPLVPVTLENGPTELRPGSHVWRERPLGAEPRWDEATAPPALPLLAEPGGAILVFDYRCYHRGKANHSLVPRHVAYVAFSLREGVTDAHNFPDDRSLLAEATAAAPVTCQPSLSADGVDA